MKKLLLIVTSILVVLQLSSCGVLLSAENTETDVLNSETAEYAEETPGETDKEKETTERETAEKESATDNKEEATKAPETTKTEETAAHVHSYSPATCQKPQTCSCGEVKGEALGHKWASATCTSPKTCTVCKATEGSAVGHSWTEATYTAPKTCTACGATEGDPIDVPGKENYHGHVYTGGSGSKKYHYEANCAGSKSHEITWDEVNRRGLGPCGTCVLK